MTQFNAQCTISKQFSITISDDELRPNALITNVNARDRIHYSINAKKKYDLK